MTIEPIHRQHAVGNHSSHEPWLTIASSMLSAFLAPTCVTRELSMPRPCSIYLPTKASVSSHVIDAWITSHTQSFLTYCISTVTFDNATLRSKPFVTLISVNALAVPFPREGRWSLWWLDWCILSNSYAFLLEQLHTFLCTFAMILLSSFFLG